MTLHTCDVSHHVTRIGTFSKWPSLKSKIWFLHKIFIYIGFFSPRGMCRDKKKGKMCCQLHFKAYFELVRLP